MALGFLQDFIEDKWELQFEVMSITSKKTMSNNLITIQYVVVARRVHLFSLLIAFQTEYPNSFILK